MGTVGVTGPRGPWGSGSMGLSAPPRPTAAVQDPSELLSAAVGNVALRLLCGRRFPYGDSGYRDALRRMAENIRIESSAMGKVRGHGVTGVKVQGGHRVMGSEGGSGPRGSGVGVWWGHGGMGSWGWRESEGVMGSCEQGSEGVTGSEGGRGAPGVRGRGVVGSRGRVVRGQRSRGHGVISGLTPSCTTPSRRCWIRCPAPIGASSATPRACAASWTASSRGGAARRAAKHREISSAPSGGRWRRRRRWGGEGRGRGRERGGRG